MTCIYQFSLSFSMYAITTFACPNKLNENTFTSSAGKTKYPSSSHHYTKNPTARIRNLSSYANNNNERSGSLQPQSPSSRGNGSVKRFTNRASPN